MNGSRVAPAGSPVLSAPPDLAAPVGPDSPVLEVLRTMRAMRRLAPDPVPRDLLEQVVEAATWAPSAMNEQAYGYVVVTDRAVMAELAELWRRVHRRYTTVARLPAATARRPAAARAVRSAGIGAALRYQAENFHRTPALIAACYRVPRRWRYLRWWPRSARAAGPRFAHHYLRRRTALLAAASSSYPATQNLLLAARAFGLAANLTAWHLYDERAFRRVLGIPRDVVVFALIPVGWPMGRFGPVRRRPVDDVLRWERW
jgi:nitroreductase